MQYRSGSTDIVPKAPKSSSFSCLFIVPFIPITPIGFAQILHEVGFPPLSELIKNFTNGLIDEQEGELKRKIWIGTPCFKVIDGAEVIGGARLIDDTASISF